MIWTIHNVCIDFSVPGRNDGWRFSEILSASRVVSYKTPIFSSLENLI